MRRNQKFVFKGKQVLLLGLVALVITAGYYRWTVETEKYNSIAVAGETLPVTGEGEEQDQAEKAPEQASQGAQSDGSLKQLKEERDRARGESMEEWKKTAESAESSAEARQNAEKRIKAANTYTEKEKTIETLIKAKGYSDCFAHINENGVTVRVAGGEMDGSKVAQMKDIIVGETGVEVRNIKISAE